MEVLVERCAEGLIGVDQADAAGAVAARLRPATRTSPLPQQEARPPRADAATLQDIAQHEEDRHRFVKASRECGLRRRGRLTHFVPFRGMVHDFGEQRPRFRRNVTEAPSFAAAALARRGVFGAGVATSVFGGGVSLRG